MHVHSSKLARAVVFLPFLGVALFAACSAPDGARPGVDQVESDQVPSVRGVADKGAHPAVVALEIGGKSLCTGTLVAPDVVLTARHCVVRVAEQVACPPPAGAKPIGSNRPASSLNILVGDDVATAKHVATAKEILAPSSETLCDADIALVVLDRDVDGIEPLPVRSTGIAKGDHVVAIGFGRPSDGAQSGVKLQRDHVKVLGTTAFEFDVGEATCHGDSGGPALDETSGEIVGVVSRGGPTCDGAGAHNVYTRTDAFKKLIDDAIAKGRSADGGARRRRDAGAGGSSRKAPTDLGAACATGSDCAAGVCVTDQGRQYCSRGCDAADHCPTHFRCEKDREGSAVCVEH